MNNYEIYNDDCLNKLKDIQDKSVDLVLIDPPYNIGIDKTWDKWDTVDAYVEFMGKVFKECERVLKDNGSFYFFHNDFLQVVELQNWINKNTSFIFKQFLVWNKRYNGSPRKYYFDNVIAGNSNRNYRQLSEYCLYYTFQEESGLNKSIPVCDNFKEVKDMLEGNLSRFGYTWTSKELIDLLLESGKYKNEETAKITLKHVLDKNYKQFRLLTKDQYDILGELIDWDFEYEELVKKHESSRYTFNNLKEHHDVLDFEVAKKQGHITPKPTDLLEYIIKTSSNEGDIVLDCFMGSGSTGVACANTNRYFIGIEINEKYFNLSKDRIEKAHK